MITRISRFFFSSMPKDQYSRLFILRFFFPQDGYYQSNQYRPQFIEQLNKLQNNEQTIVLGGDSFPFGCTTLFLNCDSPDTASTFAKKNIFVDKRLAQCQIVEIQRISKSKLGNIANFFQMKMDL